MNVNRTLYQSNWTGGVYGLLNTVQGIVIHDASAGINSSAKSVAEYTTNRMRVDPDSANYHYVLDATNCYQLIGEQYATYSLGDKNRNDSFYPNDNFISVEIAPSLTGGNLTTSDKDKYYKAWANTCKFVAELCIRKGLSSSKIYQHNTYGSTACPYTMAKYFGSYEKALKETRNQVEREMNKIKAGKMEYKKHYKVICDLTKSKNKPNGLNHYLVEYTERRNIWDVKSGKMDTSKFNVGDRQQVYTKPGHRTAKGNMKHYFISGNGREYYCVSATKN